MSVNLHSNNTNLKPRETSGRGWFLCKTLFAILSIFSLCTGMVYVFFSYWSWTPSVPVTRVPAAQARTFEAARGAFYIPEGDPEDAYIGIGLEAPEGFTSDDRKELFYTFLIIGLDEGINSDTIIVASYDGVNNEGTLISIPRDTLVNVRRPLKKINAAFPVGAADGGIEGGIAQLQREVMTIIGFIPDFYILVNFNAFVELVDAIGGVEIEVPFDMVYDDPCQDLHINIPAGFQQLDGEQALQFSRYRLGNFGFYSICDYQRITNQQTVINTVLEELIQPENILRIPDFISIFNENIHSNLEARDVLWFAGELNKIRGTDALSSYTMPTTGTSGEPFYYEFLDMFGVLYLVNRTINPFIIDIEPKDIDIISFYF